MNDRSGFGKSNLDVTKMTRKYADPEIVALTERIERLEYALNRMTEWNDSRQNLAEIGKKDEPLPESTHYQVPLKWCPVHKHLSTPPCSNCRDDLITEAVALLRRNHLETQEVELFNATADFLARYDEVNK